MMKHEKNSRISLCSSTVLRKDHSSDTELCRTEFYLTEAQWILAFMLERTAWQTLSPNIRFQFCAQRKGKHLRMSKWHSNSLASIILLASEALKFMVKYTVTTSSSIMMRMFLVPIQFESHVTSFLWHVRDQHSHAHKKQLQVRSVGLLTIPM